MSHDPFPPDLGQVSGHPSATPLEPHDEAPPPPSRVRRKRAAPRPAPAPDLPECPFSLVDMLLVFR